jgi:hypothetical protein
VREPDHRASGDTAVKRRVLRAKDLSETGLFGLIDGLNGMVGLVIGLGRSGEAAAVIFTAVMSRAGSSAVSMAGAQYQAGDRRVGPPVRWARIAAMAVGYLISAVIPALGFAFNLHAGWAVFVPATAAILFAITWFRSGRDGWVRAVVTTLLIFTLAVGAALLASKVAGA